MDKMKPTILLHCNGYWTRATRSNRRYVNGKVVKIIVDPSTTSFWDIASQVPQSEGLNHAVKISYKSPSAGSNAYVELEDDEDLVKMFHKCRGDQFIELYSVLEKATMAAREDDMPDPPPACEVDTLTTDDLCTDPLMTVGDVKKRKRKSDSKNKQIYEAKVCEGFASNMASVMLSTVQTLEADHEILDDEELWNLLENLEATLRRLRLRREKKRTSSPIEIEDDDDDDDDLIDSWVSGQSKVTSEKSASPEFSVKDIPGETTITQSDHEHEQTQPTKTMLEIPSVAMYSPLDDNVACTGTQAVQVPTSHSDSPVKKTLHKEAPIELFSNLVIAENVPTHDKIALDLQLSMLKAGSKAIVMFLKCPFDENTLHGLQDMLKIIQANLIPEFDKYLGTKPLEQIQDVFNFASRMQTFRAHDCIFEAELIYQKNIEKCKNAVKYAEKDLHLSLNEAIKACAKSRRSKERFRDILMDFCKVAESLDCALRNFNRKREKRRNLLRDYVRYAKIFEESRCDLLVAEESHTTEVLRISEKIHEVRKQKLLKEAEVLLATMMS